MCAVCPILPLYIVSEWKWLSNILKALHVRQKHMAPRNISINVPSCSELYSMYMCVVSYNVKWKRSEKSESKRVDTTEIKPNNTHQAVKRRERERKRKVFRQQIVWVSKSREGTATENRVRILETLLTTCDSPQHYRKTIKITWLFYLTAFTGTSYTSMYLAERFLFGKTTTTKSGRIMLRNLSSLL